ncbi:4Fe-4S binding protein, partial [Pseudomonas aeruginosa]
PMSGNKLLRKTAKHSLWLLIGLVTGLTFVGYFSPIRELIPELLTGQADGWAYFWVGFFTLATYGNAGWLREQVCIYMCPYARFQSVMFDKDT